MAADLRAIGVCDGDHLGLGVSFRSLSVIEGGPEAFVNALMDAVGTHGTIMLPSYTKVNAHRIFDHNTTPAYTGLIPETLRQYPASRRSTHPTNSVVALGHMAEHLTRAHDPSAREYLPYSTLSELGGKILCIGLGDNLVGFRHEVQHHAGLLEKVTYRRTIRYRDANGKVVTSF